MGRKWHKQGKGYTGITGLHTKIKRLYWRLIFIGNDLFLINPIAMESNLWSVLITAVTVLGGTTAFRFYERRAMHREKDEDFIRHDCKERIAKLEALLEESADEKEELRSLILRLTSEVAELRIKVEFLSQENAKLKK